MGACGDDRLARESMELRSWGAEIEDYRSDLFERGQEIFRDDTMGSEQFWGGKLRLHEAIAGEQHGGVGSGLTAALAVKSGLRVDRDRLTPAIVQGVQTDALDLDSVETTLELLRRDAIVGLRGTFAGEQLVSLGITCALCHSTVDDSLTEGIGRRLDGWPNRDLDVGAIVAMAPSLAPLVDILGLDAEKVREVLLSWGPGKYDAVLLLDGKAFRPDGRSAATLLPAAYGLAGQNLHTYNGRGSVPYWNAFVAATQMHGQGTFYDPRLADPVKFPLITKTGWYDKRDAVDEITPKLEALHYYQLSIPPPTPPAGSYSLEAAERGAELFRGVAQCATCHVPPLFSEPGWAMHTGAEIGIDEFQALRSPDERYRTAPLRGLWARTKGGFYHDGRFADLGEVIDHYEPVLGFTLTTAERSDLIEYLMSI
ncbi:hypothetical protein [Nannocystis sp. SCPEA4]|uniref:hypothetical protein n=1 Tax=Nannocystis sp. SCPEA4 TaxID=2996787 RepID=UPI00227206C6|nr:hypothetical protein [Nannocystis sp. SCPEA4]MCY1054593.1 hypothetical protein [Nannocystis sp. SCPEA4]